MRAMSLDTNQKEEEDNELNSLKMRLEFTNNIVINLSKQLEDLKETVNNRLIMPQIKSTYLKKK